MFENYPKVVLFWAFFPIKRPAQSYYNWPASAVYLRINSALFLEHLDHLTTISIRIRYRDKVNSPEQRHVRLDLEHIVTLIQVIECRLEDGPARHIRDRHQDIITHLTGDHQRE